MALSFRPFTGSEAPHEAISIAGTKGFEVAWNEVERQQEGGDRRQGDLGPRRRPPQPLLEQRPAGPLRGRLVRRARGRGAARERGPRQRGGDRDLDRGRPGRRATSACTTTSSSTTAGPASTSRAGARTTRARRSPSSTTRSTATATAAAPRATRATGSIGGFYLHSTNLRGVSVRDNVLSQDKPFEIGYSQDWGSGGPGAPRGDRAQPGPRHEHDGLPFLHGRPGRRTTVWPTKGADAIVADPQFVDPAAQDFRPRPGSPAAGVGAQEPGTALEPVVEVGLPAGDPAMTPLSPRGTPSMTALSPRGAPSVSGDEGSATPGASRDPSS